MKHLLQNLFTYQPVKYAAHEGLLLLKDSLFGYKSLETLTRSSLIPTTYLLLSMFRNIFRRILPPKTELPLVV